MKISISQKITGTIISSIVITVSCIVYFAYESISNGYNQLTDENVKASNNVAVHQLNEIEHTYLMMVSNQTVRPNVIKGVKEKDPALLHKLGADLVNVGSTDFAVYTDDQGNVIARGHTDKKGDNIMNQDGIKAALREGKPVVTFESGNVVKFGVRAYGPVMSDGKVIGCVVVGQDMTRNHHFVDALKAMTGAEVTLFFGKTRVSTTLQKDGKRAVGTDLDNQAIVRTVLDEGKNFYGRNILFGQTYKTAYLPLRSNGKIVGIIFTGLNIEGVLASIRDTFYMVASAGAACLVIFVLVGYIVSRRIAIPVEKCTRFAQDVAGGDLDKTLAIASRDETKTLSDSLNAMVDSMKTMIAEANEAKNAADKEARRAHEQTLKAEEALAMAETSKCEGALQAAEKLEDIVRILMTASDELSSQIQTANEGSEHQAQRISETATAMEEMNSTVLEVAKSASHAAETSEKAKNKAQDGAQVVAKVIQGIMDVQAQSLSLKQDMTELGKQADNIGRILNVISDIADQTNLLALNAAIEAARAGEAGRGFAVVADEVRKLAEKTMVATKEVGEAIAGIQTGAQKNIGNVDQSVKRIDEATELAKTSGDTLREIVEFVDAATDQVSSIATASEQQSSTSEEINRSIEDINRIAAENADAMRQSSQAVEELADQAQALTSMIQVMKSESKAPALGGAKRLPA
mgnify:CR=1 FL=1